MAAGSRALGGLVAAIAIAIAIAIAAAAPALAFPTRSERANEKLVLDFYAALNAADAAGAMKERIRGIAEKYLSPDYHQHSAAYAGLPGSGTERDKLVQMFQNMPARPGKPVAPKTVSIMAEGDLVMMLTSRDGGEPSGRAGTTSYIFNMFRVRNGKLAEHWDVMPGGREPAAGAPALPPPAGHDAHPSASPRIGSPD